jgi:hypothetical protein
MSKTDNAVKGLTLLNAPVPPMLSDAIGYQGDARFVSFQWTPYGDEAEYSDGRRSAIGHWEAFLAYIQHPAVNPLLEAYDLGSNETVATHALILDREQLEIYIAPVREARNFLLEQWPSKSQIRIGQEARVPKISIGLNALQHSRDIEEIQRSIKSLARN